MPSTRDVGLLEHDAVLRAREGGEVEGRELEGRELEGRELEGRELEGRELIVATGADRVRFLNGIVTGNVAGTPVGQGCHAALLTPKGHVVSEMWIFVRPSDIWIVVDAGQAEPVAAALARYAIMDDFAAAPQRDFRLFALLGPAAPERLAAVGVDVRALADGPRLAHAEVGGLWLARVHQLGVDGFWLGGPPPVTAATWARLEAAGTPELEAGSAEAARIAAGEPRFGAEITTDYFPMEVGLDDAIDYGKGCYLGQEPIVRVRDRGRTNWRLAGLEILGPGSPRPGDTLESDLKPKAGRVTSAGRFSDGRAVALAMLHVSVPVGATVRIRRVDKPADGQIDEAAGAEIVLARVTGGKPAR
jgi:folate-binding protein YgfZ